MIQLNHLQLPMHLIDNTSDFTNFFSLCYPFLYLTKKIPRIIPFNLLRITFEPVTDILYPKASNKSIGITNFSDWIALTHGRVKKVFKQPIMCIVYLPRVMYIWMKQTNIYFKRMIMYSICIYHDIRCIYIYVFLHEYYVKLLVK